MKKIVIPVVAVLLLLFLMFSCSSGNTALTSWEASITKSKSEAETVKANDTVLKYFKNEKKIPGAFLKYLKAKSPVVRKNAIIVLGSTDKEWAKKYKLSGKLYPSLKDSDVTVRREAAVTLLKWNNLDKDMNLAYEKESDKEVRSYLAGLIAFSMKTEDLSPLKEHMQDASQKEALLVIFKNFNEDYQDKWKSLSEENKISYVAELVPALENSVVATELNEFLHTLTGNKVKLGNSDYEKSLALHKWKTWINQQRLAILSKKSASELKILVSSEDRSLEERFLAAMLIADKEESAHNFITQVLQDSNRYHQVVYSVSPKYYDYFVPHISQKEKNSPKAISFLIYEKNDKSIAILNENITFLNEKYQRHFSKMLASKAEKQNTQEENAGTEEENNTDLDVIENTNNVTANTDNVVANVVANANNENANDAGNKQENNAQVEIKQESLELLIKSLQSEIKKSIQESIQEALQQDNKNTLKRTEGACVYDNLIELSSKTNEGIINEPYVYEIDVKALQNAGNVTVMLIIPEGTTYLKSEPTAEVQDNVLIWNYRVLRENEVQRIKVWLISSQEGNTPICSFAKASPTCCANVHIGKPLLELSKIGPQNALLGEEVTYTLSVKNTGTATAKDVVVNDIFMEGFEHESGEYKIALPVGDLKVNETKTFDISLKTTKRGVVCNRATANSSNADPVEAEACTTVLKRDLAIALNCVPEGIVGEKVTGTLEFENTGDTVLTNAVIETTFGEGIKILSLEHEGEVSEGKIVWNIKSIAVGEKKAYNVVLTGTVEGEHCVYMKMTTGEDIVRETYCCTLWRGIPELTITKKGPETAILGTEFTYEITVESIGTTAAKDVVIVDILPANLTHESGETVLRYPVGDMPIGDKKSVTVTVTATAPGEAKNTARTESSNTEPVEDFAITIIQRMDAEISVVCVESAKLGERAEFAIQVRNTGDVPLSEFGVAISVPKELTILSGDCDPQISEGGAVWNIGVFEVGAEKTCKLVIAATAEGSFDFNATFTSAEKVSKSTSCSSYWIGEPKLEIVKSGPATAILGTEFEYEIVVKSVGTVGAENVVLVDTLPYNLSHETGQRTLTYDLGNIAVGESKTTIVKVRGIEVGEARNVAQASGRRAPSVEDDAVTIIQSMDAEISLVCVESAKLGERIESVLQVRNTGDVPLSEVSVVVAVPQELTVLSGDCDPQIAEGAVIWKIGTLESGADRTCRLVVTATAEGTFGLESTLTTAEKVTKSADCSTYWLGEPRLEIVKTAPATAILGTDFEYEIVVKSVGTVAAENVVLIDTLPYHVKHESGERTLSYDLGTIAVGESKTTVVKVTAVEAGEARNMAQTSGRRAPSVEDDAVTIIQRLSAELNVACTGDSLLGERVDVTLSVTNTGDVALTDIKIVSNAHNDLVLVSADCAEVQNNASVWAIANLAPGDTKNCTLVVSAKAVGNLCVQANMTNAQGVTKSVECCTKWTGVPKLTIVKTGPQEAIVGKEVAYTVRVESVGTIAATNVVVTDTLPAQLTHESGERTLRYELGDMAPGESKELTVVTTAVEAGQACNIAKADSVNAPTVEAQACTELKRLTAELTIKCPPVGYLEKRSPSMIIFQNTGDIELTGIRIKVVALTDKLKIFPNEDDNDAVVEGDSISWTIAKIAPGKRSAVKVYSVSKYEGDHCIEVSVNTDQGISKKESCCSHWKGFPALLLEVIDTEDPVMIGELSEYKIEVTNQGTADDRKIRLRILMPAETDAIEISGSTNGTINGKKVEFERYPVLKPGEKINYSIVFKGLTEGDSRLQVYLSSETLTDEKPVLEEESTQVY